MYLREFMRRLYLFLLVTAALVSFCSAQDSTYGAQPSQADCVAAATSGGTLPPGCSQDYSGSAASTRDQQGSTPTLIQAPQLTAGRPEIPERALVPPLNPSQIKKIEQPLQPDTEFEQIVADTIGRTLPLFGQTLFAQPPSTFASTNRAQVPGDYVIGPDDELQIRIWGQVNADLRVVVDRSGDIYIPRVGQIPVAGIHYSDLDQYLKGEIQKTFHNFNLTREYREDPLDPGFCGGPGPLSRNLHDRITEYAR